MHIFLETNILGKRLVMKKREKYLFMHKEYNLAIYLFSFLFNKNHWAFWYLNSNIKLNWRKANESNLKIYIFFSVFFFTLQAFLLKFRYAKHALKRVKVMKGQVVIFHKFLCKYDFIVSIVGEIISPEERDPGMADGAIVWTWTLNVNGSSKASVKVLPGQRWCGLSKSFETWCRFLTGKSPALGWWDSLWCIGKRPSHMF